MRGHDWVTGRLQDAALKLADGERVLHHEDLGEHRRADRERHGPADTLAPSGEHGRLDQRAQSGHHRGWRHRGNR